MFRVSKVVATIGAWSFFTTLVLGTPAAWADDAAPLMSKGAYLARAGDCNSCHIAGPHQEPFAGGLPLGSPMGIIYATNITPDPEFGIGRYTLEDFSRALRQGIAKDGHHLYPAMPYPSFARLSDDDIAALYDYFMHEVAPFHWKPKETALSFPFNQRWALAIWNFFFARSQPFKSDPLRDDTWNRGAYLVQSIAHCGACHTPRGIAFQEEGYSETSPAYLTGALEDNYFSADLTGDYASGLGRWSQNDLFRFLKHGRAREAVAFGNMQEVVENSLVFLSDADVSAIAHYVKSLPPEGETAAYHYMADTAPQANATYEPPGAGVYANFCARCHQTSGRGVAGAIPGLSGNPAVLSQNPTSLIRIILEGENGPKADDGSEAAMPGFAAKLDDEQIGDVLSFIRSSFGNYAKPVTTKEVKILRQALAKAKN